ncbi:MAG: hypothetical protein RL367_2343, partial [Pseudomonadota bacterium]
STEGNWLKELIAAVIGVVVLLVIYRQVQKARGVS